MLPLLRAALLLLVLRPGVAAASAQAVPVLAALVTLIGLVNARRVARVVQVDIPLTRLPAALAGFTIVQISDIHVGPTIKRAYVQAIVDRVNALDADLIAITGDVVDGSVAELAVHTAPLGSLRDAVAYPVASSLFSDDQIKAAMTSVGLSAFAGRLDPADIRAVAFYVATLSRQERSDAGE